MTRKSLFLWTLLLATPLLAQTPRSIEPSTGSTAGEEVVLIHGDFGTWPPMIRFGLESETAVEGERIAANTIRVVTPPHLPGTVPVWFFDYDMWIDTGLTFTFEGPVPLGAYERVLLPIFTPTVFGAHGSEFRSELRIMNRDEARVIIDGLHPVCLFLCPDVRFPLDPGEEYDPLEWINTGRPGVFLYVLREHRDDVVMQLRAYDVSRESLNFGTEIPVVGDDEFQQDQITLLGVPPADERFRNTLRIYAAAATDVLVEIEGPDGHFTERYVTLRAGGDHFDPAYAEFTDFPNVQGPLRVTITQAPSILPEPPPPPPPPFWAFISVTNNETQHITLISPQR